MSDPIPADASTNPILIPCKNDDELHEWLVRYLDINVPRAAVCDGHQAPFDYVRRAYVEPARDLVVWAPRGGGKTRLAAAATLLDLLHKPGVAVRILGGSLEQSLRLWEHLLPDLRRLVPDMIEGKPGGATRKVRLTNTSTAAVLTQSQRAVRGLRVQKLRCDEVEGFDARVWDAAQLVTKSAGGVAGVVEALSTMHAPFGQMARVVDQARTAGTPLIKWCLLDVLERCPPARACAGCALWDDCRGVAKTKCAGFVKIDDAISMMGRVSREVWEAEMLCRKPNVKGCVFPSFDEAVHVRETLPSSTLETTMTTSTTTPTVLSLAVDFGFHAPFVCLWVVSRGDGDRCLTHVIDEYVQPQRVIEEHVEHVRQRPWGTPAYLACDPAGAARNDQTAASNVQILKSSGFDVRKRHGRIQDGVEMIRAALRPAAGAPRLFVHPRCARLIKAMRCFRYADGGSEQPVKDGEHDHLIDALRYHFANRAERRTVARKY